MTPYRIADHRLFSVDGRDFLFLSADTAVFEIDAETRDLLERSVDAAALPEDRLAELVRLRVVVPVDGDNTEDVRPMDVNTLVLHLTGACNLACDYCCQGGAHTGEAMSAETAKRSVDFLITHSGAHRKVTLVLFGGEPLLNFKVISEIVPYARKVAAVHGKNVDFSITTNGALLTDRVTTFLMENGIGVTVSIDGFDAIHDRFRKFPDGSPTYGAILPGVRRLLAGKRPVVARATVARDPDGVPAALDHLLSLGFAEAGFAPVTTTEPAYQLDAAGMDRLLDRFRVLTDRFLATAATGDLLGFTNLIDLLVTIHEGEVKSHPCGAGLGMFAVGPDGRLFPCQRLAGEDHLVMGSVFEDFDGEAVRGFRRAGALSAKTECRACWARSTCAGGCYHEALVREGDLFNPNRHYCDWIRGWLAIGLDAYARLALTAPDYLDNLSLLRGHPLPSGCRPVHQKTNDAMENRSTKG
jgi:uncharacterized protein